MEFFPVTDSTISNTALNEFVKEKYFLGEGFSCSLFRTGINDTYFLSNGTEKYVARVYSHNWRSETEILEEIELLCLLKEKGLSVSFPIRDTEGCFVQALKAPEGNRFMVLFSFAEGDKVRFLTNEMCAAIGDLMAKMHQHTKEKKIERKEYTVKVLLKDPYDYATQYFSESLKEMEYLKSLSKELENSFSALDAPLWKQGIVHMDIWYDNLNVGANDEITLFDFDFCGNGWLVLDVAYFCSQLFQIEVDKKQYEEKVGVFLDAYQKTNPLSEKELQGIPAAGAAAWLFYLGVQSQRFDWSNIFLTENYLKMVTGRIKNWLAYAKS